MKYIITDYFAFKLLKEKNDHTHLNTQNLNEIYKIQIILVLNY
jgi:hypothetical protein